MKLVPLIHFRCSSCCAISSTVAVLRTAQEGSAKFDCWALSTDGKRFKYWHLKCHLHHLYLLVHHLDRQMLQSTAWHEHTDEQHA